MSYAPQPYPPQYGYPPGYPRPSSVGPTARWAGIVAIILGVIALLMGGCIVAVTPQVMQMPELRSDPNVAKAMEQLEEAGITVETLMYIFGGIILGYGAITLIVGVLLAAWRSKASSIIGLVVFIPVVLLLALNIIGSLFQANIPAVVMGLVMVAPHVLIIFWLIQSLRGGSETPMMYPGYPGYTYPQAPPPQPMQGYYQPPKQ